MKLSIITVNLNNRDGLKKTIDSVVSQTFRDFEWIVIDGGSTDGSKELIEQYAEHFAYWVSEPDKGIYNAMNKGIKVSKGEYLHFLNSGDWLCDNQVLENIFVRNHYSEVLCGDYYREDGKLYSCLGELWNGIEEDITLFTLFDYSIQHSGCAFIKRSLFDEYGLYDEELRIASDWKWFLQVLGFGEASLKRIDVPISVYDTTGVSSIQIEQREKERKLIIDSIVPSRIVLDYEKYNKLRRSIVEEQRRLRMTWSYKVGRIVTAPIRCIKRLLL